MAQLGGDATVAGESEESDEGGLELPMFDRITCHWVYAAESVCHVIVKAPSSDFAGVDIGAVHLGWELLDERTLRVWFTIDPPPLNLIKDLLSDVPADEREVCSVVRRCSYDIRLPRDVETAAALVTVTRLSAPKAAGSDERTDLPLLHFSLPYHVERPSAIVKT